MVALLLLALTPCAAPVPDPPRGLTAAALVGNWDYAYGGEAGRYSFGADGTYACERGDGDACRWRGTWEVTGRGDVRLVEWEDSTAGEPESRSYPAALEDVTPGRGGLLTARYRSWRWGREDDGRLVLRRR